MIGYLKGKYLSSDDSQNISQMVIDVQGVGYQVHVSTRHQVGLMPGNAVEFYIYTNLRENALELFGFASSWEKKVFLLLTSVSGVGPKTALSVLGGLDPETLLTAIVREDRVTLTKAAGIGKKTAERLIVELVEKAQKLLAERPRDGSASSQVYIQKNEQGDSKNTKIQVNQSLVLDLWNEALDALGNLGYRESEAMPAIRAVSDVLEQEGKEVTVPVLIRRTLQSLARN